MQIKHRLFLGFGTLLGTSIAWYLLRATKLSFWLEPLYIQTIWRAMAPSELAPALAQMIAAFPVLSFFLWIFAGEQKEARFHPGRIKAVKLFLVNTTTFFGAVLIWCTTLRAASILAAGYNWNEMLSRYLLSDPLVLTLTSAALRLVFWHTKTSREEASELSDYFRARFASALLGKRLRDKQQMLRENEQAAREGQVARAAVEEYVRLNPPLTNDEKREAPKKERGRPFKRGLKEQETPGQVNASFKVKQTDLEMENML